MVFKATLDNISIISRRSVLLVEEFGVPGENNRPATSHQQLSSLLYIHFDKKLRATQYLFLF